MKNFEANRFYNTRGGSTQVNVKRSPETIKMIHPPHFSTEILFFSIIAILNLKEQLLVKDFNQPK